MAEIEGMKRRGREGKGREESISFRGRREMICLWICVVLETVER